ncbi:RAD52 motif-containing protein 1-like [Anneissia japonica]|uniref:RAD52 motif-containing protein 1-like n=1 Tax=Anneissia japonica TaxID=1529436 RepID=UPI0014259B94|nr:RAD52 motif-containing protein 1-like [Anneissia japonica]XP_033121624.1 RAD52 motif-containing protein 1-like [Anneissia japonica]XP_033121625.1 RAD52 motif-containing protein 1-like [Anneissia japonica]XP_033121627.1 RAD52 motif-containing protein 1-like [Anneissia japonica]
MDCEAELIEFKRPLERTKTLYITGISNKFTESECVAHLKSLLDKHGLIYDILVFRPKQNEAGTSAATGISNSYAFVKFYSTKAVAQAKAAIHLKHMLDGQFLKADYPKGSKILDTKKDLFIEKCYELANYYLGFNGWSSQIISLSEYTEADEKDVASYVCNARILFRFHDVSSDGVGLGQVAFSSSESKMTAIKKAKRVACNRAYENAFSKCSLVVLNNGKVAPVVDDTTSLVTPEELEGVVKVNKIDVEPEDEVTDEIDWDNTALLQDINEQLLIDLQLQY